MADDLEHRLIEIEHRLTFSERTLEELSGVVTDQGRRIEALHRQLSDLITRLQAAAEWQPSPQDDKPPPHY